MSFMTKPGEAREMAEIIEKQQQNPSEIVQNTEPDEVQNEVLIPSPAKNKPINILNRGKSEAFLQYKNKTLGVKQGGTEKDP